MDSLGRNCVRNPAIQVPHSKRTMPVWSCYERAEPVSLLIAIPRFISKFHLSATVARSIAASQSVNLSEGLLEKFGMVSRVTGLGPCWFCWFCNCNRSWACWICWVVCYAAVAACWAAIACCCCWICWANSFCWFCIPLTMTIKAWIIAGSAIMLFWMGSSSSLYTFIEMSCSSDLLLSKPRKSSISCFSNGIVSCHSFW